MKHIFIVNPTAGKKNCAEEIRMQLQQKENLSWDLFVAPTADAAAEYVRTCCEQMPDEKLRFYACGGDGSLSSVLRGVYGHDNASMTSYPVGSGNDFVRYYGGKERFLDLDKLLEAPEEEIDLIRAGDRLCINAFDLGFDAYVCDTMMRVRRKPIIGGNNAYYTGIIASLFNGMRTYCRMTADGEEVIDGDILLCTAANGKYVGGGFQCAPRSDNADGLMELCLVRPVGRLLLARLIGTYKKGGHLDDPRFAPYLIYRRAKKLEISSDKPIKFVLDGDVVEADRIEVEVLPRALRFAVPK